MGEPDRDDGIEDDRGEENIKVDGIGEYGYKLNGSYSIKLRLSE